MTSGNVQVNGDEGSQHDLERTKQDILLAATEGVAKKGFEGTRVDEIGAQTARPSA